MISLLLSAALASSPEMDVSLAGGFARTVPGPVNTSDVRPQLGVVAGMGLRQVQLRTELHASFGTLPYDGSPEVHVRGMRGELALLAGWHGTLVDGDKLQLGVDALVGPSLLHTRVATSVLDRTQRSGGLALRPTVSVGPWLGLGHLVVGARVHVHVPVRPQWLVHGSVGVRFGA